MPCFAANLSMLFTEAPFLERFKAAEQAGFNVVEFMFPYEFSKGDVAAALKDNGLELVLHNLPAGDWSGEGDLVNTIEREFDRISHMQVSP